MSTDQHPPDSAGTTAPLHQLSTATSDAQAAADWLSEYFPGTHLDLEGRPRGEYLRASITDAAGTTTGRLRFGVDTDGQTAALPTFCTAVVLTGRIHVNPGGPLGHRGTRATTSPGRSEQTFTVGQPYAWVTGTGIGGRYSAGTQFGLLQVPQQRLAEAAEARTGLPAPSVRVLDLAPVSPAAGRYWAQLMAFTHRDLDSAQPALTHPLVARHWQEHLASAALTVFANTTLTAEADHVPGAGRVGPATVRRALAHAEAHAHEPIGVEDLARAAGIGVRALQLAYARHVGVTPTAHLRQVRLRRAHAELVAAVPSAADGSGTTVAAVAHRWGSTPQRFASAYRAQYGRTPSAALRG